MSTLDSAQFNRALFYPRPDQSPTPVGAHDVMVPCADAVVHLRIHHRADTQGTLLLFHGNGEVAADYDDSTPRFAACGVALAVADFRGYGMSTGRPTLRVILEDAPRVLAALRSVVGNSPLWVMGRSLGGACAAHLMRQPDSVRGFILESAASDLAGVVRRRGMATTPFSDEERHVFDPVPKLKACRKPVLILHGAQDTLIEPGEARGSLAALQPGLGTLVLLPGVGHNDVSSHPAYWTALQEFVART